jgi:TonB family protein
VENFRTPLARFLIISLAVHSLILFLWPKAQIRRKTQEPITVSFLPAAEETSAVPSRARRETPGRSAKAASPKNRAATLDDRALRQATTDKKVRREDKAMQKAKPPDLREEKPLAPTEIMTRQETSREDPPLREATNENQIIAERPIPSLKEMLPPVTWPSSGQRTARKDGPVPLDTKNPQYISYFGSIKRDIELVWEYPEQALRYGLQGKLLMEFSILSNGALESARIVRSSGSHLLDHEALRAVKAAAPFKPIPPWIDKARIDIVASFEYLDNRLNYRFLP